MGFPRHIVAKYEKKISNYNFVVSFPKSGRTWVRYFLNNYYFYRYPFSVTEKIHTDYKNIPLLRYTHAGYCELTRKKMLKEMKKELSRIVYKYNIVYIIRDPRDVFVSYYYQLTQRGDVARQKVTRHDWNSLSISNLLYDEIYGIQRIVEYMNVFHNLLPQFKYNYMITQYEKLKTDPTKEFSRLLEFLGEQNISEPALQNAIEKSSFNKMKIAEKNNIHEFKQLQSVSENENSMKVRKGKIGEYKKYFNDKELKYLNEQTDKLIPELRKCFD